MKGAEERESEYKQLPRRLGLKGEDRAWYLGDTVWGESGFLL